MFIVKDDLNITSGVGTNPKAGSEEERNRISLAGVYVVDGTINTGESPIPGQARLVAQGIFVADANLDDYGGFNFQRDLGDENGIYSAEKFIYRPDFLFRIFGVFDEILKKSLSWEEIVP